ncbi:MAG: recombinase family protein [bacterium]
MSNIRVSTDRQAQIGHSLQTQEDSIRAHARAHELPFSRVYMDDGAGGKDTDRPALARLRADLPEIGTVIVYKFDRISRSVVDLYEVPGEFETAIAGCRCFGHPPKCA